MAGQWAPRDHEELTAGWRLWLELDSSGWPRPDWDGSPDEAVRGLQELVHAADEILAQYLAGGGPAEAEVPGLIRSLQLSASWIRELWAGDTTPLDGERMALLHSDLAGFAGHARGVRTLLAEGGGWASLTL
ncbi:hypothetical protein AMES_0103 [Amycolatopsis mediterranei S699]|uniref:Uncharacterized protein n=2 Tax=Amycolatopsis mediterranei TaxID=33910 RepID=A0A0H3CX71_AMYMU|nr:hypothetical protein [Amycolatopsis mediterranei]ADJ41931.1 hypothetical protein AMED_0107 [Amycolatopsis mediterranei U32]AEK38603.1 hypothetical protein RAM_00540 [Amycolatopsis mediterranei S699]AFO73640.1 hypothetical protein AMES_0103 [Amycolatopsis mediterranei S699]AGT80769.1 hypothetical protein B737_0104 [Amycolatopsis mediterranei RB]KDO09077.1 hypothetical protein DV26_20310 [Amycolatopsis mediterranei]